MNYIKIKLDDDFDRIGARIEKTIEDIFRPRPVSPMFACRECGWNPPMDMVETDDEIVILAEIAGVEKDDLEVEINSKAVRIYGQRHETPKGPNGKYRLAEIQYGSFERILYLPCPVDTENVVSAYRNGMLKIRLTKLHLHKTHKIPIMEG